MPYPPPRLTRQDAGSDHHGSSRRFASGPAGLWTAAPPAPVNDVPMSQWTPEEISAHVQYMHDFAARLEGTGEFVDGQALAPKLAGDLSAAPGAGGEPIHEWLEVRPFLAAPTTITE